MDKLHEIKNKTESKNGFYSSISLADVDWLIKQAEKTKRYERALKTIESESHDLLARGVCTRALENQQKE